MSNNRFRKLQRKQRQVKDFGKMYVKAFSDPDKIDGYDGRGTIDTYHCHKCHRIVYTTYVDKGVTPFKIPCECGEMMTHIQTHNTSELQPDGIIYEWKRPSFDEFMLMPRHIQEYVLKGGLLLSQPNTN